MPERESLLGRNCCVLSDVWNVELSVLARTVLAASIFHNLTGIDVKIISGFRTAREQEALKRRGRPTAPDNRSTHRSDPATGVDVSFAGAPLSTSQRKLWGTAVHRAGLRWGGGSRLDEFGIPTDWQHVDGGPRKA